MTEHRVTPVVESRPVVGGAAAGRGLEVVGVDPLPWGKRVWAELEGFDSLAEEPAPLDGRRETV